jgi:hypothetical protein
MANKWRTTVPEDNAVFVKYSVNPSDLPTEMLVRKWTGIDKSVLASLITTLRAVTTVTNPKADHQSYDGVWTVKSVEPNPDESGNTAGSGDIVQILFKGFSTASPDNLTIVRSRAYPSEQNENAWMYYERYKSEVTQRWRNINAANIVAEYDKIRRIKNSWYDLPVPGVSDLYSIIYADATNPTVWGIVKTAGTFWETELAGSIGAWHVESVTEISNPIIRECWYESNDDGTYNLFRTLETTSEPAIMRTRALQYAGVILTNEVQPPMESDTTIYMSGFNNLTETIYENAKFRIGSDTYRVTADTVASGGIVTVPVSPEVLLSTETTCDTVDLSSVQIFFEAL